MISRVEETPAAGTFARRRGLGRATSITGRLHWSVFLGAGIFLLICVVLVITPWIAPYDPNAQDLLHRLAGPSANHWLGTDPFGRDVLSRLMYGGRFSVSIAAITLLLSGSAGTIIGVVSGRLGGVVDEVAMRTADVLLAFPDILMALVLIAILGPGSGTVVLALSVVGWTPFARLARSMTIEINTRGYIEAARALGCSQRFITFRHVLPNALTPVLSLGLARFGYQLITVGSLSYLGLGVQPPAADWGSMLASGQPYMEQVPLLMIVPGLTIFITALSVTIAGLGLGRKRLGLSAAGGPALRRAWQTKSEVA